MYVTREDEKDKKILLRDPREKIVSTGTIFCIYMCIYIYTYVHTCINRKIGSMIIYHTKRIFY